MEKKTITVTMEGLNLKVVFRGQWIRADVDKAYRAMIKALGTYIMSQRASNAKKEERL